METVTFGSASLSDNTQRSIRDKISERQQHHSQHQEANTIKLSSQGPVNCRKTVASYMTNTTKKLYMRMEEHMRSDTSLKKCPRRFQS